jgi:methyl-accepting chemotaxis protein
VTDGIGEVARATEEQAEMSSEIARYVDTAAEQADEGRPVRSARGSEPRERLARGARTRASRASEGRRRLGRFVA